MCSRETAPPRRIWGVVATGTIVLAGGCGGPTDTCASVIPPGSGDVDGGVSSGDAAPDVDADGGSSIRGCTAADMVPTALGLRDGYPVCMSSNPLAVGAPVDPTCCFDPQTNDGCPSGTVGVHCSADADLCGIPLHQDGRIACQIVQIHVSGAGEYCCAGTGAYGP